eukprot:COSAG02_NODE_6403_length_3598_cov_5.607031_4_plen_56_part_00
MIEMPHLVLDPEEFLLTTTVVYRRYTYPGTVLVLNRKRPRRRQKYCREIQEFGSR